MQRPDTVQEPTAWSGQCCATSGQCYTVLHASKYISKYCSGAATSSQSAVATNAAAECCGDTPSAVAVRRPPISGQCLSGRTLYSLQVLHLPRGAATSRGKAAKGQVLHAQRRGDQLGTAGDPVPRRPAARHCTAASK
eukprot:s2157_g11.t1